MAGAVLLGGVRVAGGVEVETQVDGDRDAGQQVSPLLRADHLMSDSFCAFQRAFHETASGRRALTSEMYSLISPKIFFPGEGMFNSITIYLMEGSGLSESGVAWKGSLSNRSSRYLRIGFPKVLINEAGELTASPYIDLQIALSDFAIACTESLDQYRER
jgi:hypothetical protein